MPKNETMVAMPTTLRSSKSRRQGSFEIDGSIDEVPLKLTPDDRVTKRICIFTGILSYSVVVCVVLYCTLYLHYYHFSSSLGKVLFFEGRFFSDISERATSNPEGRVRLLKISITVLQ